MKKLLIAIFLAAHLFAFGQHPHSNDEFVVPQTYDEWKEYFIENISTIDEIEGIYKTTTWETRRYDGELLFNRKVAGLEDLVSFMAILKKNDEEYAVFFIYENSGGSSLRDIIVKAYSGDRFIRLGGKQMGNYLDNPEIQYSNGTFNYKYVVDYQSTLKAMISYGSSLSRRTIEDMASRTKDITLEELIKIFPSKEMIAEAPKRRVPSSGTGFAVDNTGIIMTNYHVIENASSIKVRGVNSDFNRTYSADILISDKNNDLALIKISDSGFPGIETVPYIINSELSDVGTAVYTLGYPLRSSMGDEIKLTNGIISSRTGFQGDLTSYQTSVPVQPGNSGAPLFDSDGSVIGIVNAKHNNAENASYVVKSSYFNNLFEILNDPLLLQQNSMLKGKDLPTQVKLVKDFIYIIETE